MLWAPRPHLWSMNKGKQMFRKFFQIARPAQDDLLGHPALQEMSLRELADLPMPRLQASGQSALALHANGG